MNVNQPSARKSAGRPRYRPSPDHRLLVSRLHSVGTPSSKIARICGISPPTLRKYFRDELAAPVPFQLPSLFEQATHGNTRAAIFWAKTRCGFTTTFREESEQ